MAPYGGDLRSCATCTAPFLTTGRASRYCNPVCRPSAAASYAYYRPGGTAEENRRKWVKRKYNTTPEAIEAARVAQGDNCALCGRHSSEVKRLVVDHNHDTGQFRALLCDRCNHGLRFIEATPEWIAAARAYLQKYEG